MRPPALAPSRRLSINSMVPMYSTIPVNILQISFHHHIWSDLADAKVPERRSREAPRFCEWHGSATGNFRRVKQYQFVDYTGRQRRAIQRWSGFEHRAKNFTAAEFLKNRAKVNAHSTAA